MTVNSAGIGTVSREMVRVRAVEIALINGRTSQSMSKADLEQAGRELTGGQDLDAKESTLEAVPVSAGADPVPCSTGHKVADSSSEDEDEEGRSDSARLVDEGVREAGHDQMLQAAKRAKNPAGDASGNVSGKKGNYHGNNTRS